MSSSVSLDLKRTSPPCSFASLLPVAPLHVSIRPPCAGAWIPLPHRWLHRSTPLSPSSTACCCFLVFCCIIVFFVISFLLFCYVGFLGFSFPVPWWFDLVVETYFTGWCSTLVGLWVRMSDLLGFVPLFVLLFVVWFFFSSSDPASFSVCFVIESSRRVKGLSRFVRLPESFALLLLAVLCGCSGSLNRPCHLFVPYLLVLRLVYTILFSSCLGLLFSFLAHYVFFFCCNSSILIKKKEKENLMMKFFYLETMASNY